ncbi:hypothetical protein M0805_000245 [Coniferiporia weirii]|nr:hypothetical protein M0805_000245 [Coniferiporia weirii]
MPLPFRFPPKIAPTVPDHHRRCARRGRCLLNPLDIDTSHSKPMEDDETLAATVDIPREQTDPEKDEGGKRNRKSVRPRLESSLHTHIKVPCSLDILKSYIQQQRALLERIKLDISRLRDSKQSVDKDPVDALDRILLCDNENNNDGRSPFERVEKLGTLVDEVCGDGEAGITKDLDWELFRGHDPSSLQKLTSCPRSSNVPPPLSIHRLPPLTPSASQCTSLSTLVSLPPECCHGQQCTLSARNTHVRELRTKMVDPALVQAEAFLATLPPDSDDECMKAGRTKGPKGAKGARAKDARVKDTSVNSKRSKSMNRRKSDAAAAAASVRPRGHGGRFRKLDQVAKDTATQQHVAGASASTSTSTSTAPTPGPSAFGMDDDLLPLGGARSRRVRRPSTRFGSPSLSVASAVSSVPGARVGRGKSRLRDSPASLWRSSASASASPAPEGMPPVRLTIRIPPRPTLTYSAPAVTGGNVHGNISAATSLGTSVSADTSTSISAGSGSVTATGQQRSNSPATTIRSASVVRLVSVKLEEEDGGAMDVDQSINGDVEHARAEDHPIESKVFAHEAKSEPRSHASSDEEDPSSDSDSSFVSELLPPRAANAGTPIATAFTTHEDWLPRPKGARTGNSESIGVDPNGDAGSSQRGRNKSTTFNQTWSDEEQKLLDMLLERFPDGTKNRWANISKEMGGRRTPRQVASRVQKYFAKMKKWGVDMK